MGFSWFCYNSGSLRNPASYSICSSPNCPAPKESLCAIFAQIQFIDGVEKPIITPALPTEISNALNTKVESANVRRKL